MPPRYQHVNSIKFKFFFQTQTLFLIRPHEDLTKSRSTLIKDKLFLRKGHKQISIVNAQTRKKEKIYIQQKTLLKGSLSIMPQPA